MKNIKVSVIVPVYNVEAYLPRCLDSLVNQTLSDIEILVVNDGSPDHSDAIIDTYAARYPEKIRVLNKENGGLSDARNVAIAQATGEYLAFVNAEDYVELDMCEQMYDKAVRCDADVVCCPYSAVKEQKVVRNYFRSSMQHFGKSVSESPRILRLAKSYAWNKMYRRTFWNDHGFQFPVGQQFADRAVVYNILGVANRVECVNIPFYCHLQHGQEDGPIAIDSFFDLLKSFTAVVEFYRQLPMTEELQDEITYLCLRHTLARIYQLDKAEDKRMAKRFVNECYAFYNTNLPAWQENAYVHIPKKGKLRNKLRRFVKQSPMLARLFYTHPLLKAFVKSLFKLSKKGAAKMKKAWRKLTTGKRKLAKRRAAAKKKKKQARNHQRNLVKQNGIATLSLTQRLLKEIGLDSFADAGTLLGIVRSGHPAGRALDMNLGVIIHNETDIDRLRVCLDRYGFHLRRQYRFANTVVKESYVYTGIKVDVKYYTVSDTASKTWMFYRDPEILYVGSARSVVEMTYSPITAFTTVKVRGEEVIIPANAQQLLEERYGPMWSTTTQGWVYWQSPAATPIAETGYAITYQERHRAVVVDEAWYAKQKQFKLVKTRGYQLYQLQVLKAVADLCHKHNLTFYLADSALRYAKYYQKNAPWVSTLCVAMPVADYDTFVSVAAAELPDALALQHSSTIPHYWLPYATVRMKDNTHFQHIDLAHMGEDCGPCIYVMPLCPVPEAASEAQKEMAKQYATLQRLLKIKNNLSTTHSANLSFAAEHLSFEEIHKQIDELFHLYASQDCAYLVRLSDNAKMTALSTYPKEWFDSVEYVPFEDTEMPLPIGADSIAQQRFGYDYAHVQWRKRKIQNANIRQLDLVDIPELALT